MGAAKEKKRPYSAQVMLDLARYASLHGLRFDFRVSDRRGEDPTATIFTRETPVRQLIKFRFVGERLVLLEHPDPETQAKHLGHSLSSEWVREFIRRHDARSISGQAKENESAYKVVNCFCSGEVENCDYCDGRGTYKVDGKGNRLI